MPLAETIKTERLLLRRPDSDDARAFVALCGNIKIAHGTLAMPHPYTQEDADWFIDKCAKWWVTGEGYHFAITHQDNGEMIGMASANIPHPGVFNLGYWIGETYWHHGYATEAGQAVLVFLQKNFPNRSIIADHALLNLASGRVLEKLGFEATGAFKTISSPVNGEKVECKLFEMP